MFLSNKDILLATNIRYAFCVLAFFIDVSCQLIVGCWLSTARGLIKYSHFKFVIFRSDSMLKTTGIMRNTNSTVLAITFILKFILKKVGNIWKFIILRPLYWHPLLPKQ